MRRYAVVLILCVVAACPTCFGHTAVAAAVPDLDVSRPAAATIAAERMTPPTTPVVVDNPDSVKCPLAGNAAIVDRDHQSGWLCTNGVADARFPITTAVNQPDPGTYHVYAKDRVTTSTFGGHFSYLDNFVAFTYGKSVGARIGFHAVPRNWAGVPFQPYDTVGNPAWQGDSSGCIRVLPAESQLIWNHLGIGDTVVVIS